VGETAGTDTWRRGKMRMRVMHRGRARAATQRAGSSCFDTHPAFPVTTSPHLPLCADSAALWALLSHPSLSSFKLGVRC